MNEVAEIELAITTLRGQRVMLSGDLAALYEVPVKVLMQAVKRNIDRFPEDFMFQLGQEEWERLRSQFVTSNLPDPVEQKSGRGGQRYAPYAFTEQGIAMLSSVLRSPRAIQVNIEIMRAFVRLRRILSEHKELSRRIDELENRYDEKFRSVFEAIRCLMAPPDPSRNPIGFTAKISIKERNP